MSERQTINNLKEQNVMQVEALIVAILNGPNGH